MQVAEQHAGVHTGAVRKAALVGVVGIGLFVALVIVGGIITDGYSHVSQKISELGQSGAQYAWLQNTNFVILGLSVIGFSWALGRAFGTPHLGSWLIGWFGLVAIVHGLFIPCDVGCQGATTVGLIHNVTGITGFVGAISGMFVMARRWRELPAWRSHVGVTRAASAIALGGLVWFVLTQALDAQALAGVAQRTFAGALLGWIGLTGARLAGDASSS